MSEWFDMEKEDISMPKEKDEVHIWFEQDDNGNRYVSIKTEDLVAVLKENEVIK